MKGKLLCCITLLGLFFGCDNDSEKSKGHAVKRSMNDTAIALPPVIHQERQPYPWEIPFLKAYPSITEKFFHCRGDTLHPFIMVQDSEGEERPFADCGGMREHGLPAREGKAFIYPILIELLNWVQDQTDQRVIITCGHRCPQHNTYSDPSLYNQTSKHQIGAEVDFYVEGMEEEPDAILELLLAYYQDHEEASFREFQRYLKTDTNVSTPPWYNKEIFIKLFRAEEGRDLDNNHPYPYVSIQVRWDRDLRERVIYSWQKAHRGYLRG